MDIFCRFDAPAGQNEVKLADLPSAQNLGTFCYPTGSANVKAREYAPPEVWPAAAVSHKAMQAQRLCTNSTGPDAGVLVHAHRRRWQPHARLLQARAAAGLRSGEDTWAEQAVLYRTFLPPRLQSAKASENTNLRFPQVVCIISKNLWIPFFYKARPTAGVTGCVMHSMPMERHIRCVVLRA